jgi:coiled-coil domain-containing protein 130
MPFDVWCLGCGEHIGKGVRYNAEKKAVGKYLSSKIWSFRMKCDLCDTYFVVETDPKANDYVCKEGLRKKVEDWVPTPEDHVAILPTEVRCLAIANWMFSF